MKASKFLKLKAKLSQVSEVVVDAVKEVAIIVEKAIEETVEETTPIVEPAEVEVKPTKKKIVKDA